MDPSNDSDNVLSSSHLKRAIDLASNNEAGGPFGAVIVSEEGQIVGEGWNQVTELCDPTAHAEVQAIRNACQNLNLFHLKGCVIYASSEPCPMCLSAIYWARISKIVYGNTKDVAASFGFIDDFIYKEFDLPNEQRSVPAIHFTEHDGIEAFTKWKNSGRLEY